MSGVARVTLLIAAWAAALALLALEWTRTPLSGPGRAFLIWSLPALPFGLLTWWTLRGLPVGRLAVGVEWVVAILLMWVGIGAVIALGVGSEWVLDGLILRNALQHAAGLALWWLPGVWAAALSVAGLALALEARYRVTHPPAPEPALEPAVSPTGP